MLNWWKNCEMVEQKERTRITQSGKDCAMNCARACSWFENKRFDWPSVSFSFVTFLSINLISTFLHSISTFCTNFVFLHSKNFKFLHCLGLIDMLSANQRVEIFSCILLVLKLSTSRFEEMLMFQAFQQCLWWSVWLLVKCRTQLDPYYGKLPPYWKTIGS